MAYCRRCFMCEIPKCHQEAAHKPGDVLHNYQSILVQLGQVISKQDS